MSKLKPLTSYIIIFLIRPIITKQVFVTLKNSATGLHQKNNSIPSTVLKIFTHALAQSEKRSLHNKSTHWKS